MPRPTVARIYPERLRHNLARVRAQAPASRVMACVKANGYGHGLLTVAKVLAPHCEGLGVATLEEALTLRAARVGGELLLMEGVHEPADWSTAAEHALSVAVTDPQQLEWLARQSLPRPLRCWLKIDTGMHRLGVAPAQVTAALAALRSHPQIDAQVTLMTHFARADERGSGSAEQQLQLFLDSSAGLDLARSSANSAAVLSLPDSHLDWVRPGYMLYGGSPFRDRDAAACDLLPAMNFESRIISLRRVEPLDDSLESVFGISVAELAKSFGGDRRGCRLRRSLGCAATVAHRHGGGRLRRRLPAARG